MSRCVQAQDLRSDHGHQDVAQLEVGGNFRGRAHRRVDLHPHQVGHHRAGFQRKPVGSGECISQQPGVFMIFGQPLNVVFQRIERRGGEDAGLAHAPPEQLAQPARLADRLGGAGQRRAHRRAQTLGKTDRDRVEVAHPFGRGDAAGDDRIHEPGTIQMHGEVVLAGPAHDLLDALDRMHSSAAAIMRVLQADQPGSNVMGVVAGPDGASDICQTQDPAVTLERPCGDARKPGNSAGLPDVDVCGRRAQQFVTRLGVDADADLVSHCAGGDEHRRFLPEQLGRPGLEPRDGGVFTINVIADFRLGHRAPHRRRGPGHCVGTKVDWRSVHWALSLVRELRLNWQAA